MLKILYLILMTFLPFLELRYSIPAGILHGVIQLPFGFRLVGFGLNPVLVFVVVVITNFIVGLLVYLFLMFIVEELCYFKWFRKWFERTLRHYQKRVQKKVDKYGLIGVALFIAVPLPGSGVYSGALGAYALGLDFKKFMLADLIGVLIAGILVTIITLMVGITF